MALSLLLLLLLAVAAFAATARVAAAALAAPAARRVRRSASLEDRVEAKELRRELAGRRHGGGGGGAGVDDPLGRRIADGGARAAFLLSRISIAR